MNNINIRRLYYLLRHRYLTLNNVVVVVGVFVAISWAWGSVGMMERNYALQKQVDAKRREQQLLELETSKLAFEKRYHESEEYQELAVRERLGLAKKGEKALVLPPNSDEAKRLDDEADSRQAVAVAEPSNVQQWLSFVFGDNSRSL